MLSIAEWTDRALALSSPMKLTSSASFSPSIRISLRLKIHQAQAKNFCRVLDIRVPQTVEHDARELRVCILPFEELLADEHRLHRQTVGQTEQHPTVMVACRVFSLVCRQLIQPLLQFFF